MMLNNCYGLPRKCSEDRSNRITVASYAYNHLNQRISKTTPDSTTHYHHDAQGRLWSETDELGNTIRDYIWMGDMPVAMVDYPEGIERITYMHADHLNTPRYGTNQVGDVVWQWQSDAFGNGLPNEDVDGDGVSVQVNLRFPGQYYDAESDLHYNWNRYYDPAIGRYITSDPIGLEGGLNTFAYVGSSPVNWIDPNGLDRICGQGREKVGFNPDGSVKCVSNNKPNESACFSADCKVMPKSSNSQCFSDCISDPLEDVAACDHVGDVVGKGTLPQRFAKEAICDVGMKTIHCTSKCEKEIEQCGIR